jgi:hypothetical protein
MLGAAMTILFNDLPQPVRERFVQITSAANGDPRIITRVKAFPTRLAYYAAVDAIFAEERAVHDLAQRKLFKRR